MSLTGRLSTLTKGDADACAGARRAAAEVGRAGSRFRISDASSRKAARLREALRGNGVNIITSQIRARVYKWTSTRKVSRRRNHAGGSMAEVVRRGGCAGAGTEDRG